MQHGNPRLGEHTRETVKTGDDCTGFPLLLILDEGADPVHLSSPADLFSNQVEERFLHPRIHADGLDRRASGNYDWIVAQDIKYALLNKAPGTKDYPLESNYDGYNRIYEKTKIALRDAGGIFSWTINMDSQTKYNLTKRIGDTVRDAQKIGLNRFTKQISIFLDNNLLNYNINTGYPYYDVNNRTLVPIRATAEAAGLKVTWNQETLTATAEKNGTVIKIPLNKNQITINGETKTIDTNAVSYNGRIYIPIRAAFEGLGYKNITWNRISNTIYVDNDMTGESK